MKALPAALSSLDRKVDELADEINVAVSVDLHNTPAAFTVSFGWQGLPKKGSAEAARTSVRSVALHT